MRLILGRHAGLEPHDGLEKSPPRVAAHLRAARRPGGLAKLELKDFAQATFFWKNFAPKLRSCLWQPSRSASLVHPFMEDADDFNQSRLDRPVVGRAHDGTSPLKSLSAASLNLRCGSAALRDCHDWHKSVRCERMSTVIVGWMEGSPRLVKSMSCSPFESYEPQRYPS